MAWQRMPQPASILSQLERVEQCLSGPEVFVGRWRGSQTHLGCHSQQVQRGARGVVLGEGKEASRGSAPNPEAWICQLRCFCMPAQEDAGVNWSSGQRTSRMGGCRCRATGGNRAHPQTPGRLGQEPGGSGTKLSATPQRRQRRTQRKWHRDS